MSDTPSVLIVDDRPDESPIELERDDGVRVEVYQPHELTADTIAAADVILLDYSLGDWWPDKTAFACQPRDGLALMSVISAHIRHIERRDRTAKPTGVALISGRLAELAPADIVPHHHLVARAYGLEWAFGKKDPLVDHQVGVLAQAVHKLPDHWPDEPGAAEEQLRQLLSLGEEAGVSLAWSDVQRTTPPLYELSRATEGIAIVRWLLHRILPYPTFLWSTHQLAARFRVKHTWLRQHIEQSQAMSELFEPARYRGILAGFLGPRWWGAKIDDILWRATGGKALSIGDLHDWLGEKIGSEPDIIDTQYPVICLDGGYQPMEELVDMDACVRIQRDDWPAHAESAWVTKELANESAAIHSRVVEYDRDQLDDDDGDGGDDDGADEV